ncbi:MspA family porin [Nocardia sp. R16R-3T]
MRPPSVVIATGVVAAALAVVVLRPGGTEPSHAQPPPGADVSGAGIHLMASVENVRVDPAGDRTPNYLMTFAHAAQLSGDYSLNVEGDGVTSGQAVAGFILGCAVSVAGGVTVGIEPNQGVVGNITPTFSNSNIAASLPNVTPTPVPTTSSVTVTVPTTSNVTVPVPTTSNVTVPVPTTSNVTVPVPTTSNVTVPVPTTPSVTVTVPTTPSVTLPPVPTTSSVATTSPSIETTSPSIETTSPTSTSASPPSFSLGPSVGGLLGVTEVLEATLAPGQITTVTTVTSNLDEKTAFPYHFIFNNAALNIGQCASPVSAVPFITASVGTPVGTVQTTAYGRQFTF